MSKPGGADLHVHTTASDGVLSPAAVVRLGASAGLEAIAITDHDTMAGIPEGSVAARAAGFALIPGVELSTEYVTPDGRPQEVHILGYFPNPTAEALARHMDDSKDERSDRARRMVAKLNELGVKIDWERVLEIAGDARIGRPHVARAILEKGYASSWQEVFDKWIGNDAPGYVGRTKLAPEEAVAMLRGAGAVTALAHPLYDFHGGSLDLRSLLPRLVPAGLQGLEVYCPRQPAGVTDGYLATAREFGLIATGGSDYHGEDISAGVNIGDAITPHDQFQAICELGKAVA